MNEYEVEFRVEEWAQRRVMTQKVYVEAEDFYTAVEKVRAALENINKPEEK